MAEFKPDLRGGTDIAALAGGVVAVSISLFAGEGPYGPLSLAITASLFVVILGYVWRTKRRVTQSLAVAAAIGLIGLPACGYGYEFVQSSYYNNNDKNFACLGSSFNFEENKKSRVCQGVLYFDWWLIFVYAFLFDRLCQEKWSGQTDDTARVMSLASRMGPYKNPKPPGGAHKGGQRPDG